jgi:hypothetical protein
METSAGHPKDVNDFFQSTLARWKEFCSRKTLYSLPHRTITVTSKRSGKRSARRNTFMPKTTEFTIQLEDKPGSLGKCCNALAEQGVNILALEAFPRERQNSTVRLVVDNPTNARTAFDKQHVSHEETEVAQVKLAHKPGELARAATKLGEASVNINYVYCGAEPGTNAPLLFFGVSDVRKAVMILDEAASKAA